MEIRNNLPEVERRTFAVELRADQENRSVEGYAAVYDKESNQLGWFKEIIEPGAFKRALERSIDIVALFNHDENIVLGRSSAGTLEVWEDEQGLRYRIPELPKSREDVLESIKRGDINKSSFAFTIAKGGDKWEERDGMTYRTITDFDMIYDVSPVTYPAYSDTTVAKRSYTEWANKEKEESRSKAYSDYMDRKMQLMRLFL